MTHYQQVTVIGMGLVGSSLVRVMAEKKLAGRIVVTDNDPTVCKRADALGLGDEITADGAEAVRDSDLVVLAMPVGAMAEVARNIAPVLKPGAVITDTGSTKTSVIAEVAPLLPDHAIFIPSHPIAGTEFSGPDAGFANLFRNRFWIVIPGDAPATEVGRLKKFLAATGAEIAVMDAEYHDQVLAITSHLPHLIAYTIVGTAFDFSDELQNDIIRFAASGFRDFTRIASSDPIMWRDVFTNNTEAVLAVLQRFNEDLQAMQAMLEKGEAGKLQEFFTRTRSIRERIRAAGQLDD